MSLFLNAFNAQEADPVKIENATTQFMMMQRTFNGILDTCMAKCLQLNQGDSGDLAKGEQVCVDRCVAKIFRTHMIVHEHLRGDMFRGRDTLTKLQPRIIADGDKIEVTKLELKLIEEGRKS
ncbi:hypothetical protein TBLA_0B02550 [Henningerozyma blattae CBS 6284]|uniref:Mitochondrial import inner membrane translocase subunit n=1 Tax=Henningerozyma blattae (strain ATCC 34711 / CBS 6284 / DSM 70876 / NBRC 10599 / NRRL Y-10934 / UCD 77-7) TaxID=1071380 RepID=I2GY95_HENB6|nr:hypothetical protein TBLA_0B02550 [Tetrapisispora blattae CBS 6284]CCH59097.1 hypothetical protein TBLA_0B02550 [Tetrapisispora blattae CBS 6284]